MPPDLGRFSCVGLRDVWESESKDFTPWLAKEENLEILGEALGIEIELVAQEKLVGPFRADMFCKDIGTGSWVLVENQLEPTDHRHLGQLLTYASGLEAAMIVWIAARFTDEHRSTLDWLNEITDESFRFFGLEIELWRIDESRAAPKFNIVSKPNDWSRSVAQAIDKSELSEVRMMQLSYWSVFHQALDEMAGPVSCADREPLPQPQMAYYSIGKTGFNVSATMIRRKRQIRAALNIVGDQAKSFFDQIREQKQAIEQDLGYKLDWEDLPTKKDCRISVCMNGVDLDDKQDWPQQHKWLATKLNELHKAFLRRVNGLNVNNSQQ